MTKKQLVEFLKVKQEEALKKAKEVYDKANTNYKLQFESDMKMDEVSKKIAMLILQADDLLDAWLQYTQEHSEIEKVDHYNCLKSKLNDLVTAENVKEFMYRHINDVSESNFQIANRYKQIKQGISNNYTNVIANVQQLKDAKLGIQYLTELGFDLTALLEEDKHPVTTALSVPVDTSYLFIDKKGRRE